MACSSKLSKQLWTKCCKKCGWFEVPYIVLDHREYHVCPKCNGDIDVLCVRLRYRERKTIFKKILRTYTTFEVQHD